MGEGTAAVGTDRRWTRCEREGLLRFPNVPEASQIGKDIGSRERRHSIYRVTVSW